MQPDSKSDAYQPDKHTLRNDYACAHCLQDRLTVLDTRGLPLLRLSLSCSNLI